MESKSHKSGSWIKQEYDLRVTWTWKLIQMYEKLHVFSKPFGIIFCIIVVSYTLLGILMSSAGYESNIAELATVVSSLFEHGFIAIIPIISANIYNQFLKIQPGCHSVYPTYSYLAVVCLFLAFSITVLLNIVGLVIVIVETWDTNMVAFLAIQVGSGCLLFTTFPIPFLMIGTSTSFIIESCQQTIRNIQI